MSDTFGLQIVQLLNGLGASVLISVIGIIAAMLLGCVLGAVRYSRIRVVTQVIAIYVNVMRCTPLIVQIFLLYFALPEIGIRLSPFEVGWVSLALWGAAYQVETFRSGFEAVSANEILAARALGMSGFRTFLDVVLPLGVRTSIPAMTTVAITQFRSSSFMVAVGYTELTYMANNIVSQTFEVFKIFGIAALMYLIVCTLISYGSRLVERKFSLPGLEIKR
jgi:polar amino acid transport system permease protein